MVKQIIPAITFLVFLSSCSTFKPLNFTSNRQVSSSPSPASTAKFIDDISVTPQVGADKTEVKPEPQVALSSARGVNIIETPAQKQEENILNQLMASRPAEVEMASSVQLKYAVLMNTEVESLPNKALLENVDEWYGVRYRTGGNTKSGVDCSGFTVAVYAALYGIMLPRVSREQYRISRKISTTELQEGDLVFFNTNGSGVSHVGVYLGNNKFIHASVSKGVMVNGLFEPYYLKRYYGAGRIDDKQIVSN
ncbi:MAG: NlpC/P60 family protein [Bacteroidota bacterium]|nr:NlpC/P60 family protein [Bacteroidota bacterium]